VIGYGNRGDLDELWPQKPDGLRLVMAAYGTNPSYPGKIAHQYTNGQGFGGGLPEGADPFGVCDMNSADGLHPHAFASACGITIAVEPAIPEPAIPEPAIPEPTVTEPTTVPTPAASGFTEQDRQLLTAVYDMLAKITGGPPRAVQSPNDSGPRGGPTKATKRSPAKSTKRSPAKAAKAAPAKATKRSPAAMAEGTPVEAAVSAPAKATKRSPAKAAKGTPVKAAKRTPAKAAKRTPAKAAKRTPTKRTKRTPRKAGA
jgi:hypothetical protein